MNFNACAQKKKKLAVLSSLTSEIPLSPWCLSFNDFVCLCAANGELCSIAAKHYTYFSQRQYFNQAMQTCKNLGSGWKMAMPRTQAENKCVYNLMRRYQANVRDQVWLGFFRKLNGPFQAVDGKPLQKTFWAAGHPERVGPRTCATMWGGALLPEQWSDFFCTSGEAFPVMCQKGKFRHNKTESCSGMR